MATTLRFPRGWYVVGQSASLRGHKPQALRRFSLDLLAWRKPDGGLVLQQDRCPHRSARLSLGELKSDQGGRVVCPFHGFEFDALGHCTHIPELGRGAARMCVPTFLTREAHGFVWMWWGPPGESPDEALPWFDDLGEEAGYTGFAHEEVWPAHYTRCVENQLDYAHLPYVHRTSIGRFVREPMEMEFELDEKRLFWRNASRAAAGEASFIEMHLPNVWQNRISPTFALSLAFIPVDAEHTLLLLTSHLKAPAARLPLVGPLMGLATTLLNRWILGQDRRVVLSQQPADSLQATDEILVGSDRVIRTFRRHLEQHGVALEQVLVPRKASTPLVGADPASDADL